ncbi:hypothetical protein EC968_005004 [Mortierella alpina]|nr:hypothetical protein EC968_005004 [Mortierella alpina]
MGRLEPACFSSGSDNALYALVFAYDLSVTKVTDNGVVALIKSNSNPSGPEALAWQCLVDPSGGFLAWSYLTYQPGQPRNGRPRPGGFRYDPLSTTPSATTTGKGGWVIVDSPITYSWSGTSRGGSLMYLADGAGKYNFYHAYFPSTDPPISFGALNTAVTPNMMEETTTKWALDFSTTGYINNMRISSTNVFLWGSNTIFKNPFSVATLPQSGPLPTTTPVFQAVNFTTAGPCATSGVLRSSVYTYCADRKTHGDQYSLYEWNGSKSSGPINMAKLPTPDVNTGVISEVFGDPTSTLYMLIQSGYTRGGRPTAGTTILKALVLTGAKAGSVLDVPNNITVSDNLSSLNATTGGSGGPGRNGGTGGNGDDSLRTAGPSGMSSTVKVVLGVVGALVIIGTAVAIVLHRRRKQRKFMVMQEQPSTILMQPTDGVSKRV